MHTLDGTIASRGYAYGRAYLLREGPLHLNRTLIRPDQEAAERRRLHEALARVRLQMHDVESQAQGLLDDATRAIFESYQNLLDDDELVSAIETLMREEGVNAAWAVQKVMEEHADAISRLTSPYLRERATDIRDLKTRIIRELSGSTAEEAPDLSDRILVAEDLSPAQSVQLNLQRLQGLLMDRGGVTSHTSILARALNIPAIVGTRNATRMIHDSDWILMDAVTNKIYVNPDAELVARYQNSREARKYERKKPVDVDDQPTCTLDGRAIILAANIGLPVEAAAARAAGAEGFGLFRTEFLFMNRADLPDEEEQFIAYRSVLEQMKPHAVIVRTMDIGGDKDAPQLKLAREDNPFLGLRGLRISLRQPMLLRTQLRALLRASAYGSLKIMVPMVASVEEIIAVRQHVQEARQSLDIETHVDLGIMIETPASAMLAPHLIRYVDFFSVGTNDLTQYTLAVDRGHTEIHDLYQPLSPAVLLIMQKAIQAAVQAGKWAGVCGELSADPMAALLLIGMGATELSMSPAAIHRVKQVIRQMRWQDLQERAEQALLCATVAEVKTLLQSWEAELHFS